MAAPVDSAGDPVGGARALHAGRSRRRGEVRQVHAHRRAVGPGRRWQLRQRVLPSLAELSIVSPELPESSTSSPAVAQGLAGLSVLAGAPYVPVGMCTQMGGVA
jgi:hypothetical protein